MALSRVATVTKARPENLPFSFVIKYTSVTLTSSFSSKCFLTSSSVTLNDRLLKKSCVWRQEAAWQTSVEDCSSVNRWRAHAPCRVPFLARLPQSTHQPRLGCSHLCSAAASGCSVHGAQFLCCATPLTLAVLWGQLVPATAKAGRAKQAAGGGALRATVSASFSRTGAAAWTRPPHQRHPPNQPSPFPQPCCRFTETERRAWATRHTRRARCKAEQKGAWSRQPGSPR